MLILQLSTFRRRTGEGGQDTGSVLDSSMGGLAQSRVGALQPNRFGPSSSFAARSPPLLARHCTTPRVSQSFPASRPPQDKETEVEAEDKDKYGWHSPQGGSWFATRKSVTFGFWRAFPPSSSLLPTCSCCCSPPLLQTSAQSQQSVTLRSAHQKLLAGHNVSANRSARTA